MKSHLQGITMNKNLRTEELWSLCNREKWFECGTQRQYNRLFDMNKQNAPLHDLALIIWICSTECEKNSIENIEKTLRNEIEKNHATIDSDIDLY